MDSSCVIGRRNVVWMGCRDVKGFSCHARSGWSLAGTCSTGRKKRANFSSACLRCETIWDFFPRNTIRARNGSWEIFRRHFRTLRFLLPPESLRVKRRLRYRSDPSDRLSPQGQRGPAVTTALWAVCFGEKSTAHVDRAWVRTPEGFVPTANRWLQHM